MNITQAIHETIKKFEKEGIQLKDINNGQCEDFAMDVIKLIGGETKGTFITDTGYLSTYGEDPDFYPGHIWICSQNRHFDCDTPEGVEDARQLPIFQNGGNLK